jgi:hypothetical protein
LSHSDYDDDVKKSVPEVGVRTLRLIINDKHDTGVKLTMAIGGIALIIGAITLYYRK